MLSPILIFGAGIHSQWILNEKIKEQGLESDAEVLRSWGALLRAVSLREGIFDAFSPLLCNEMPTLQWERLVQAYVASRGLVDRSFEAERHLKKSIADILNQAAKSVECAVDFEKMAELAGVLGRHTLSLNMDTLFCRLREGSIPNILKSRREYAVSIGDDTLWFPHGSTERSELIAFGVRRYGHLPSAWSAKFKNFKAAERRDRHGKSDRNIVKNLSDMQSQLAYRKSSRSLSLMHHLLAAPLIIFGASLSREEWGIWWLLNQRARNLARLPKHEKPPTRIVISATDSRLAFWTSQPVEILPILTENWSDAWNILIDWMSSQNELARGGGRVS